MSFNQFLAEQETARQSIQVPDSVSLSDPQVRDTINQRLNHELTDLILSPESGIQKIRKVLHLAGLEMPALYDAETEGDELVFEVGQYFLYLIYYLADDGRYDFYAELTDEAGLTEIMSEEDEEE
jgi:hypothetical protein